ncbi:MAG: 6-phosphogluconolactonase [Chitinophagaceae bacterium]|jgi:6-phosphogluconolactonase|nr:MAG: 6-phosphogluconolactonase [Chitinophagaceae bacterium]
MQTFVAKNTDELSRMFADWLVTYIQDTLKKQDRFTISLSGGSTPKKLYQLLATDEYAHKIDWPKLHFFWGDERFVPFTDERNNARMSFDELLDHVPVNKAHIHVMRTDLPPDEAVNDYDEKLHQYFDGRQFSFDLVMLGLGDDAHTLSLFPGYPVIKENEKWMSAFYLTEQNMYRITITKPIVNKSSRVAFLVSGSAKVPALKAVLYGEKDPAKYPAQVIQPANGELYWFLDEAAAAALQ